MKPIFVVTRSLNWASLSGHADLVYLEQYLEQLDWNSLSKNPNAMPLVETHLDQSDLNWYYLSHHPKVFDLLSKPHLYKWCEDRIYWCSMCHHENAISFFETHLDKISWHWLCEKTTAIPLLEKHVDKIDWFVLSGNPSALPLLEKYPEKIDWGRLNQNPSALPLLEKYPEKIQWHKLSKNPNAIHLLETSEHIDWDWICLNPKGLSLLEKHPEKIVWELASYNPHLLPLFEKNLDKVKWDKVCCKTTPDIISFLDKHVDYLCFTCWKILSKDPNAIPLLEKYPEKIQWNQLSKNPNALPLLEQNPEKIDWTTLCANPNAIHLLFHLDHARMEQLNQEFKEELLTRVFDPGRVGRMSNDYGLDMRSYLQQCAGCT